MNKRSKRKKEMQNKRERERKNGIEDDGKKRELIGRRCKRREVRCRQGEGGNGEGDKCWRLQSHSSWWSIADTKFSVLMNTWVPCLPASQVLTVLPAAALITALLHTPAAPIIATPPPHNSPAPFTDAAPSSTSCPSILIWDTYWGGETRAKGSVVYVFTCLIYSCHSCTSSNRALLLKCMYFFFFFNEDERKL